MTKQPIPSIIHHFSSIEDPRIDRQKKHELPDIFFIKPATPKKSPLDVKGVGLNIGATEIVDLIREGREQKYS